MRKGKDMQVVPTKPVSALVHKMWCTNGSGPVTLLGNCGPCRGWLQVAVSRMRSNSLIRPLVDRV